MLGNRGWRFARVVAILGVVGGVGCGPSALEGEDGNVTPRQPTPDAGAGEVGPVGWSNRTELAGLDLRTIWGSGSDLFAAGAGDLIAHSEDNGSTWQITSSGVVAETGWP